MQSTHNTVAGCQKRQMYITLANLTKTHTRTHTETEITYEHKTTKKERKDSEITQYEWHNSRSKMIKIGLYKYS